MNPLVYIIILNWNGRDLTLDCLKSLTKVQYDNYKILVVDNGSSDDSVKTIRNKFPNVEILQLESNIGYAAGNNAGFEFIKNQNPFEKVGLLFSCIDCYNSSISTNSLREHFSNRLVPSGTVGGLKPHARNPFSARALDASIVASSSPMTIITIGL